MPISGIVSHLRDRRAELWQNISPRRVAGPELSVIGAVMNDPESHCTRASGSSYEIRCLRQVYVDAVCSAVWNNLRRINSLSCDLTTLLQNGKKTSPAWIVVTSYYLSFFQSISLCDIAGRHVFRFTNEDCRVMERITGSNAGSLGSHLNCMFNATASPLNGSDDVVTVALSKQSKPHRIVWSNMAEVARLSRNSVRGSDASQRQMQLLIKVLNGSDEWQLPIEVRNEWNYGFSRFYHATSTYGSIHTACHHSNQMFGWAKARNNYPNEKNRSQGLMFLKHVMKGALDSSVENLGLTAY